MNQQSNVLSELADGGLMFWCPGCEMDHLIYHGAGIGPRWTWNGNAAKPTFSPSVLVQWDQWVPPAASLEMREKIARGEIVQTKEHRVCHSFVKDGRIQFLGDCTHRLAGQTVDLPAWSES